MSLEVEDGTHTKDVHDFQQFPKSAEDYQEPEMNGNSFKKEKEFSVEELFASTEVPPWWAHEVPPWWAQITFRGILVSIVLGVLFSVITFKLSLTTGIIPSLNISAGLLGFFFLKSYTKLLSNLGISHRPFTRQENTVIQTCVVACYGLAFSGGFGSYLTGMDSKIYTLIKENGGSSYDSTADIKDPQLGWIISYMFAVGFLGLLAVVPLRKVMIIDYKLTYPSGTATAVLINRCHTPHGYKEAMKQVTYLGKYFTFSFFFSLFKWFFGGLDDSCGFDNFPTLGFKSLINEEED